MTAQTPLRGTDPGGSPLPSDPKPLPGRKPPPGAGRLGSIGLLLGVLLVAIGLVGLRDGLVSADVMPGPSLVENGIKHLDGAQPQWWWVAVGVIAALLGLGLLALALLPRPASGIELGAATGVSLDYRGVRRIAAHAAEDVDGVLQVRVAGKRRLRVRLTATERDERIEQDVRAAVAEALSAAIRSPRVKVRIRTEAAA
jgi:hypothetical protein